MLRSSNLACRWRVAGNLRCHSCSTLQRLVDAAALGDPRRPQAAPTELSGPKVDYLALGPAPWLETQAGRHCGCGGSWSSHRMLPLMFTKPYFCMSAAVERGALMGPEDPHRTL